jgi:glycosyltransferase involved in cell wall biosynthesis
VQPVVSVVMAVLDGERFLAAAVDSVLRQSLAELELVVVDDGSTDATARILAQVAARDARVVVHRQHNAGRPAALNRAIALARAPLVARLDADDLCLPERLARQVEFLERHDAVALVGGAVRLVDAGGRVFEQSRYPLTNAEIRSAFAYTTPFVHSAVMFRRGAVTALGGYRACNDAEDLDLWLRLSERHELANLPDPVVAYRIHSEQVSARKCELQALGVLAAHACARARREGEADPLDAAPAIDEDWLLARGVTPAEIALTVVKSATWLAKVVGRAGQADQAEALLAVAESRARTQPDARALLAIVHRARATRRAEQGRFLRARYERGRALLAERRR